MTYDNWKTTNPADAELGSAKQHTPRRKPITYFWAKPIPIRSFDWEAVEDGYDQGDPIGYGSTEAEAIADLQEQIDDRDEERCLRKTKVQS